MAPVVLAAKTLTLIFVGLLINLLFGNCSLVHLFDLLILGLFSRTDLSALLRLTGQHHNPILPPQCLASIWAERIFLVWLLLCSWLRATSNGCGVVGCTGFHLWAIDWPGLMLRGQTRIGTTFISFYGLAGAGEIFLGGSLALQIFRARGLILLRRAPLAFVYVESVGESYASAQAS